jgi:hypothetical protein
MLILGIIAAPNMPAGHTDPQVHPLVTHLETFFTSIGAGFHFLDLVGVSTFLFIEAAAPGEPADKVIHAFHT